jgi:hypothetical protein
MELLHPHGLGVLQGATALSSTLASGIKPDEIVLACKCWLERRPDNFTPKTTGQAVDEFLERQRSRISERRHRTNTSYLTAFKEKFGPLGQAHRFGRGRHQFYEFQH